MRKLVALAIAIQLLLPGMALAQFNSDSSGLNATAEPAFGEEALNANLASFIGAYIISPILGITGILFLVLTVYAGFLWMTSTGDSSKVKHAKDILVASLTGAVIMALAYVVTNAVVNALTSGSITGA